MVEERDSGRFAGEIGDWSGRIIYCEVNGRIQDIIIEQQAELCPRQVLAAHPFITQPHPHAVLKMP